MSSRVMPLEVIEVNKPSLDRFHARLLAIALDELITKFYDDPENVRKFQEWNKNKEVSTDEKRQVESF